jgi:hypothetical protein
MLCAIVGWGESGNGVIDGIVTSSHITSEKVSTLNDVHIAFACICQSKAAPLLLVLPSILLLHVLLEHILQ